MCCLFHTHNIYLLENDWLMPFRCGFSFSWPLILADGLAPVCISSPWWYIVEVDLSCISGQVIGQLWINFSVCHWLSSHLFVNEQKCVRCVLCACVFLLLNDNNLTAYNVNFLNHLEPWFWLDQRSSCFLNTFFYNLGYLCIDSLTYDFESSATVMHDWLYRVINIECSTFLPVRKIIQAINVISASTL